MMRRKMKIQQGPGVVYVRGYDRKKIKSKLDLLMWNVPEYLLEMRGEERFFSRQTPEFPKKLLISALTRTDLRELLQI